MIQDRKANPPPSRDPRLPPKPKGQTVGSFSRGLQELPEAMAENMQDVIRHAPSGCEWLQVAWPQVPCHIPCTCLQYVLSYTHAPRAGWMSASDAEGGVCGQTMCLPRAYCLQPCIHEMWDMLHTQDSCSYLCATNSRHRMNVADSWLLLTAAGHSGSFKASAHRMGRSTSCSTRPPRAPKPYALAQSLSLSQPMWQRSSSSRWACWQLAASSAGSLHLNATLMPETVRQLQ